MGCEGAFSTELWSNEGTHIDHHTYLPLVDSDRKLLPLHFLAELELGYEEQILNEYCECHVTQGSILTAKQATDPLHQHSLLDQLIDEWLNMFRKMDKHRGTAASAACSYDSDT